MSKPEIISVDQFLSERKDFVKSGDVVVKGVRAPASWNPEARSAKFVMSSEAPDRDKDIINQAGLDITEFMKNPQGLMFHNSRSWPIGTWSDVVKVNGRPKRTEGVLTLMKEGEEPDADRAAKHIAAGTLRAVSIGFIPKRLQRRPKEEDAGEWSWPGYEILESEMVECSIVPVPAQPAALVKSADGDDVLARELLEYVLDTYVKMPGGLIVPRERYEEARKALRPSKALAPAPVPKKGPLEGVDLATDDDATVIVKVEGGEIVSQQVVRPQRDAQDGFFKGLADLVADLFKKAAPPPPLSPEMLGTTDPDPKQKAIALAEAEELDARIKSLV